MRFAHVWPATLLDAYDLLEVYPLSHVEIKAITQATQAIANIYARTAALLRTVPDEALLQMGLPRETLNLARMQIAGMPDTVIGRLDLAKTPDGYKMLEFNSDTPGMLIEAFPINAKVCEESGRINPNRDGESTLIAGLKSAIRAGLAYVGKTPGEQANVVFASCSTYKRDSEITRYLMSLLDFPENVQERYVNIESLSSDKYGLYDPDGNKIDVLFRFYPIQFLARKMFPDHRDQSVKHDGQILFDLISRHRLAFINPPSAFLLECKATQVVIWGLHETGEYFNAEERSLIERYFLPTYMDPGFGDERHVVKPVYGSEGDTVTIVDPKLGEVSGNNSSTYLEQPMVYQKYVDLPLVEMMTEDGTQSLRLLTSCFLINGRALGICLRAGSVITDYSWWYVPVCAADSCGVVSGGTELWGR